MPAGRPAKPLKIHQLDGTFRADRHARGSAAKSTGGRAPVMPRGLDPTARAMWRHVVATRGEWLAESDGAALQTLCETWSLQVRTKKMLGIDPADKVTRTAYCAYVAICERMLAKFGMTPTDRARLGEQSSEEIDPAAEFIA